MRNTFILTFLLISSLVSSQDYQCDDSGTVQFSMMDCSNDFITFTVTTTNGNSTSGTFTGLPSGTTINNVGYNDGNNFSLEDNLDLVFNVPSAGCALVNAQFTIDNTNNDQTCNFNTILGQIRNIPTLGQWGLICLSILLAILGVAQVKTVAMKISSK